MWSEFSIIQMLHGIFHVIISNKLTYAGTIFEHVSIADIASNAHVVLNILPTTSWWQARNNAAIIRSTCWRSAATLSAIRSLSGVSWALLQLNPQAVAVKVVAVASFNWIFGVERVVVLNEREWWTPLVLQVDVSDFAIFVKQIFQIFVANIGWEIALNNWWSVKC